MGKIALVHDFLFTYGGAERVLSAFHRLYPDAPIYTMLADPEIVRRYFPKAKIITSSLQRSFLRRRPQLLLGAMPRAIEEFNLNEFNLVLSSSGAFSHGVITGPDTFHLCYCHSPMRYVWDWHAEYLKEKGWTSPLKKWFAESFLSPIRLWDRVSAERPDAWIANSQTVQERIAKFYGKPSEIIYPPVDTEFFTPPDDIQAGDYAITASRLSPYKRVDQMILACEKLGIPLRVIGDGEDKARLENLAGPTVTFLGRLSEQDKRREIAGARCFLFAAEDDFGIAPLEALSLGIPAVALARGGATEYVQDGKNGILYAEDLAEGLERFLKDGVEFTSGRIRQSALKYGTEHFDIKITKAVDDALKR